MSAYNVKSEADLYLIISALNIAAERYSDDSSQICKSSIHPEAKRRICQQFDDQAATASRIARELEELV